MCEVEITASQGEGNFAPHLESMLVDIELIAPDPRKEVSADDEGVETFIELFESRGMGSPVLTNADGMIVMGHYRYEAVLQLGWTRIVARVASADELEMYSHGDDNDC